MIITNKNHIRISKLIKNGNLGDVLEFPGLPEISSADIIKKLKESDENYKSYFKQSQKIVNGYISNKVLNKDICALVAIELSNNGSALKISNFFKSILIYDNRKRILYILKKLIQSSETIKKMLVNEKIDEYFLILIKNILRRKEINQKYD